MIFSIVSFIFIIYGIIYSRKSHRKIIENDLFTGFLGCILSFFPWYVTKTVYILAGILCFMLFIATFFD
jgi:hypothetical protein